MSFKNYKEKKRMIVYPYKTIIHKEKGQQRKEQQNNQKVITANINGYNQLDEIKWLNG